MYCYIAFDWTNATYDVQVVAWLDGHLGPLAAQHTHHCAVIDFIQ